MSAGTLGNAPPKPVFQVTEHDSRPSMALLNQQVPCTKITAASESHWSDIAPGTPDTIYLDFRAASASLDDGDDVTVHVRAGVTVARAREALKGIRAHLKCLESLEQFTPKHEPYDPDADSCDLPF